MLGSKGHTAMYLPKFHCELVQYRQGEHIILSYQTYQFQWLLRWCGNWHNYLRNTYRVPTNPQEDKEDSTTNTGISRLGNMPRPETLPDRER